MLGLDEIKRLAEWDNRGEAIVYLLTKSDNGGKIWPSITLLPLHTLICYNSSTYYNTQQLFSI